MLQRVYPVSIVLAEPADYVLIREQPRRSCWRSARANERCEQRSRGEPDEIAHEIAALSLNFKRQLLFRALCYTGAPITHNREVADVITTPDTAVAAAVAAPAHRLGD